MRLPSATAFLLSETLNRAYQKYNHKFLAIFSLVW